MTTTKARTKNTTSGTNPREFRLWAGFAYSDCVIVRSEELRPPTNKQGIRMG